MNPVIIAIDAMSGDKGLYARILACKYALKKTPSLKIILVGRQEDIVHQVKRCGVSLTDGRVSIEHAEQIVEMDDEPLSAIRHKKNSSMRVALELLKKGKVDACVSAGNTGALFGMSMHVIKTLPCIERAAIISSLPTQTSFSYMLDLGANVNCSSDYLYQFGVMGAIFATEHNLPSPRVALLNIGEEEIKGTLVIKEAAEKFKQDTSINYIGFVEGDQLFSGRADVIVSDGFVGNVALKTIEGVAKLMGSQLRRVLTCNTRRKFMSYFLKKPLEEIKDYFNPSQYNGATFVGLNKTVVKSHGNANALAFSAAINEAHWQAQRNVPDIITKRFNS